MELSQQANASPTKRKENIENKLQEQQQQNADSTFITRGAENTTIVCDNCSKEVAKQSFQLHYNYCVKNISKCPYCKVPVLTKEMEQHVEQFKGTDEQILQAIQEGNFDALNKMQIHGADFNSYKDVNDKDNSLLHIAAKMDNKELIDFLKSKDVLDFDIQNSNGETALHLVCG